MKPFLRVTRLCLSVFLLAMSTTGEAGSSANTDNSKSNIGTNNGRFYGSVIETMDSGSYTYAHVDSGKEKYWVAAPTVALIKGSMVSFVPNMPMNNFTSKSLDRTFDLIYFVAQIQTDQVTDHAAKLATVAATDSTATTSGDTVNLDNVKKASDGFTIAEALTQKQELAGQTVVIRGLVVKYTPQVMKKNWIHIRDSSSEIDLTVTTSDTVQKGDIVLVSGKLRLDKDFGYGYLYDVLLEDSSVTIE